MPKASKKKRAPAKKRTPARKTAGRGMKVSRALPGGPSKAQLMDYIGKLHAQAKAQHPEAEGGGGVLDAYRLRPVSERKKNPSQPRSFHKGPIFHGDTAGDGIWDSLKSAGKSVGNWTKNAAQDVGQYVKDTDFVKNIPKGTGNDWQDFQNGLGYGFTNTFGPAASLAAPFVGAINPLAGVALGTAGAVTNSYATPPPMGGSGLTQKKKRAPSAHNLRVGALIKQGHDFRTAVHMASGKHESQEGGFISPKDRSGKMIPRDQWPPGVVY